MWSIYCKKVQKIDSLTVDNISINDIMLYRYTKGRRSASMKHVFYDDPIKVEVATHISTTDEDK